MERTSLYKKAANSTAAKPRLSTGCKKPEAPLPAASAPSVVAAPPEVEVSSPVGVDSSESESEVAVDSPEVWVRVPVGTVLLPPVVPFPLMLPGTTAPPDGAAEPAPPTIEVSMDIIEVSMDVLLASAGEPAGMVSATAVLVKTGSGWVVTGVG